MPRASSDCRAEVDQAPDRDHGLGDVAGPPTCHLEGGIDQPARSLRVPRSHPGVDVQAQRHLAGQQRSHSGYVELPRRPNPVRRDEAGYLHDGFWLAARIGDHTQVAKAVPMVASTGGTSKQQAEDDLLVGLLGGGEGHLPGHRPSVLLGEVDVLALEGLDVCVLSQGAVCIGSVPGRPARWAEPASHPSYSILAHLATPVSVGVALPRGERSA